MIMQKVGKFERMIFFEPGWDKRDPNPSKNYGIGSASIKFLVRGNKGAIQFYLSAGWYPHLIKMGRLEAYKMGANSSFAPMPLDIGYHAYEPQYEGQEMSSDNCPYLDDKPCYYDGSTLRADQPFRILTEHGDEALWEFLEEEYENRFGDEAEK